MGPKRHSTVKVLTCLIVLICATNQMLILKCYWKYFTNTKINNWVCNCTRNRSANSLHNMIKFWFSASDAIKLSKCISRQTISTNKTNKKRFKAGSTLFHILHLACYVCINVSNTKQHNNAAHIHSHCSFFHSSILISVPCHFSVSVHLSSSPTHTSPPAAVSKREEEVERGMR